jgi:hypothetical protein
MPKLFQHRIVEASEADLPLELRLENALADVEFRSAQLKSLRDEVDMLRKPPPIGCNLLVDWSGNVLSCTLEPERRRELEHWLANWKRAVSDREQAFWQACRVYSGLKDECERQQCHK